VSLKFLLDENISHVVATQFTAHRPEIPITSVYFWREGTFQGRNDATLLRAAREESLTLVTYDQNTIPALFFEFMQNGEDHAGVIFVDQNTVASDAFGTLIRSLTRCWDACDSWDWTNRVTYLTRG
jgi:hypothetical protein